jgi:hypothetical protein
MNIQGMNERMDTDRIPCRYRNVASGELPDGLSMPTAVWAAPNAGTWSVVAEVVPVAVDVNADVCVATAIGFPPISYYC